MSLPRYLIAAGPWPPEWNRWCCVLVDDCCIIGRKSSSIGNVLDTRLIVIFDEFSSGADSFTCLRVDLVSLTAKLFTTFSNETWQLPMTYKWKRLRSLDMHANWWFIETYTWTSTNKHYIYLHTWRRPLAIIQWGSNCLFNFCWENDTCSARHSKNVNAMSYW